MTDSVENRIRNLLAEAKKNKIINEADDSDDDDEDSSKKNNKPGVVKKEVDGPDDDNDEDTKKNGKEGKDAYQSEAADVDASQANNNIKKNVSGKTSIPKSGDNEDNKKSYTDTGTEPESVKPGVSTKKTSEDENINKKDKNANKKAKVTEHLNALVDGEDDLSEDFKTKAATIFETALNMREDEIRSSLEEEYNEKLEEAISEKETELVEKVDGYLDYVVEKWLEENDLAVTNGLKNEMLESFVAGMKSLFEEHYIEVPDAKVDVFEELEESLTSNKKKLNEAVEENIRLTKEVEQYKREKVFAEQAKGLTESQKEKFETLAEDAAFEDEESFAEKLKTIRESYFSKKPGATFINEDTVDNLKESNNLSKDMQDVTSTIDRLFRS